MLWLHRLQIEPRALLADVLRDQLRLTGTHIGCDTSQCGCCTVHLDGEAVKSCTMLALQAEGKSITTIEGLATGDGLEALHPVQRAFVEEQAMQCGYCIPGLIMGTVGLLAREAHPSSAQIREALTGLKCRCGTHVAILRAIKRAQSLMA